MNKFIQKFEEKVKNTIKENELISKEDKIIVACSGGKDSTTVLYLLNKLGYNTEAFTIDLLIGEWSKDNLENVKSFCREHKIKLHITNIRKEFGASICYIRSTIQEKKNLKNCTICGIIKRWMMNKKSRELGATKLATGHNLDDEAETIMMNIFQASPKLSARLGPKTGVINDEKFVQRIKPLYFCTNKETERYSKEMGFPVLYEACPCAVGVFRGDVRKAINEWEKATPGVKKKIVKNFLKFLPSLKQKYKKENSGLNYCKECKEPSRNKLCKRCKIMKV